MGKIFLVTFLIIGTIIGAGFASGKEIVTFFGDTPPPMIALFCAILTFLFCAIFLFVGKKCKSDEVGEVNVKLFGKLNILPTTFMLFNSLVSLSAMLAGANAVMESVLPLSPLYAILLSILSALVVYRGIDGLYKANAVIVPFLIIAIISVCAFAINCPVTLSPTPLTLVNALTYMTMNGMLAASVLTTVSDLSAKQIILASLFSAIIVGALVLLITLALCSTAVSNFAMPLLEIAKRQGTVPFVLTTLVTISAIFTTAITAHNSLTAYLNSFTKSRKASTAIPVIVAFFVSNIGFEKVVNAFYPVVGILGLIFLLSCVVYLIKTLKRPSSKGNESVHYGREQT